MSKTHETVRIIHFDDEVNSVSMIPNSLYNYFSTRLASWVDESKCTYERYVSSFVVEDPGGRSALIEYDLTDSIERCRQRIAKFDKKRDIAIFDLMRQTDDGIASIGKDLYARTRKLGVDADRIFILSGFPEKFEANIPASQRFMKPTPSIEVVRRLVALFPDFLRV